LRGWKEEVEWKMNLLELEFGGSKLLASNTNQLWLLLIDVRAPIEEAAV